MNYFISNYDKLIPNNKREKCVDNLFVAENVARIDDIRIGVVAFAVAGRFAQKILSLVAVGVIGLLLVRSIRYFELSDSVVVFLVIVDAVNDLVPVD